MDAQPSTLRRLLKPGSFSLLLVALAVSFLANLFDADVETEKLGRKSLLGTATTLILLLAVIHATAGHRGSKALKLFGIVVFATGVARLWGVPSGLVAVGILLDASFLVVATGVLMVHLFRSTEVDADMIVGSFCIYLLLGMVFAFGYHYLDSTGEAFRYPAGTSHGDGPPAFRDLMYYSYVTLTTLGYGDVIPISPPSRALAVFEAVIGQFYLAVLVARLLGLHLAAHRNRA